MTATPIRRLLDAKPFVSFTVHGGFEMDFLIDDPKRCRLDEEAMILYVSRPEVRPPPKFARQLGVLERASVEIIDLRHVSVKAETLPD